MDRWPQVSPKDIPWLTTQEMRQADALAMGPFGIDLLQMMELAGARLASLVRSLAPAGPITVLAGSGNNGGGVLCAARHLADRGRAVSVVLSTPDRPGESTRHHLVTLGRMGMPVLEEPGDASVVLDGLVGYGLVGPLHGRAAHLAAWSRDRWTASLDLPSGLGCEGAVDADATLTLALPKEGLRDVRPLFVADIGLPGALWTELGVDVPALFADGPIVQVA